MSYWCDGSGKLELELSEDEYSSGYHSGDCEDDVRRLLELPHVAAQVGAWDMEAVRENLRGYGAWDEDELADDDMSRARTLWLACGDMVDNPQSDDE